MRRVRGDVKGVDKMCAPGQVIRRGRVESPPWPGRLFSYGIGSWRL